MLQHVPADVYWYYMVELGFYTTLLFSQFADVQRKVSVKLPIILTAI